MNLEILKNKLSGEFNLICFEDLGNYRATHRAIFDLFKQHHREAFDPNQVLVLYSSYKLDQEFLNHIQRAALKIDISNYFIMLVTPFDLSEKLQHANKLYGNDSTIIRHKILTIDPTIKFETAGFFNWHDNICVMPFVNASTTKNVTRPCCKWTGDSIGDSNHNSLTEIFNGTKNRQIREKMLNGDRLVECQVCWNVEQSKSTSLRLHMLNKWGTQFEQEWVDEPKLRSIELTPTNLCNFSCRICNAENSSKIAIEELKFSGRKDLKNISVVKEVELNWLLDSVADLNYLHIFGGEPMKWPSLLPVLNTIVEQNYAKNIQIELNTNGSVSPEKLKNILPKFKSAEILLSIDDIGERFELQRGGKWALIFKNIQLFKELQSSTVRVKIALTVNIQNLLYLDELVDFCQKNGFEIVWWYLEKPYELCIDNVTQQVKDIVQEKYANHENSELRQISNRVTSTQPVSGQSFLNYMKKLDKRRGQDFKSSHNKIFDAMSQNKAVKI